MMHRIMKSNWMSKLFLYMSACWIRQTLGYQILAL